VKLGADVFPDRPRLKLLRFYTCDPCGARVGCHKNGKPLGTLANEQTRRLRQQAHAAFDPLWQRAARDERETARRGAYAWLRETHGVEHFGQAHDEELRRVIAALTFGELPSTELLVEMGYEDDAGFYDLGVFDFPW